MTYLNHLEEIVERNGIDRKADIIVTYLAIFVQKNGLKDS
jgi:hypothetical protein